MPLFSDRAIRLIADAKIEAAIKDGEFDTLSGMGKPFEFDELRYDPNWWIRCKLKQEKVTNLLSETPEIPVASESTNSDER